MEEVDLGISCLWNLRQPHSPGSALARPPHMSFPARRREQGSCRHSAVRGPRGCGERWSRPTAPPGHRLCRARPHGASAAGGVAAGGTWGERSFRPPCATLSARQAAEATALGAPGLPPAPRDPERVVSLGHGQGVGWEGVCLSCHAPVSLGEHWKNAQGTHSLASASIPHRLLACHLCSHGRV